MLNAGNTLSGWKLPLLCAVFTLPGLIAGCERAGEAPAKVPPAKVKKSAREGEPASVLLTAEAEARLGIRTVSADRRHLQRVRVLGGEVMPRPGSSVTLSAPIAATLQASVPEPVGKELPVEGTEGTRIAPGQILKRGQLLFTLVPLLPAASRATLLASRVEAEGALSAARVQVEAADISYERARKLLLDKAGSQRSLDEARANRDLSRARLESAETHRDLLQRLTDTDAGTEGSGTVPVRSPLNGVLLRLLAAEGQLVGQGDLLAEIADLERLWLRVPVYAGDLPDVDTTRDVEIASLGATRSEPVLVARPVTAPPTADAAASTVDLYYELAEKGVPLRPGQRVAVTLPLRSEGESIVVPWAAVIHDSNGCAWVYEEEAPRTFLRCRVQVRFVLDDLVSLESGPEPGSRVVTDGAAELFGTELGVGK